MNSTSKTLYFLVALVGALALYDMYGLFSVRHENTAGTTTSSAILNRALATKTLRVGYLIEPPYLMKGDSPDHLKGIFYDLTEALGNHLGLRVVWVEEVSLATLGSGLETGRYDMIAFTLWRNAGRAKSVGFSIPLYYSTLGAYVRSTDHRFDNGLEPVNSPEVKVATMDGELAGEIAKRDYPLAHLDTLPQLSDYSQMLLEVVSHKADITFYDEVLGSRFIKQNPGSIKEVSHERPVRVYAECFILPLQDTAFKSMIDATLSEMIDNGEIDRAFRSNGENPDEYYRPALPFRYPLQR